MLFEYILGGGSLLADVFCPPTTYELPEGARSETAQQYIQRLRNNAYATLALWGLKRKYSSS